MAVSAPGGKKVSLGDSGVKSFDTDLKKSQCRWQEYRDCQSNACQQGLVDCHTLL